MGWKATGRPTVRKQRDKWVVRTDGIDTESGKHRPRQLGTYVSQRAARTAAARFAEEGAEGSGRGTVGWLVDTWVTGKIDITEKSQMQNRWAAGRIRAGLGAIRLNQLDREDIARWYEQLADGGVLNKRSITIIRRVLRAALEDAVDEGMIRRNPAARVPVSRRSELLALKWDDFDVVARTVRVDEALVEVEGRPVWTEGKNERSRRTFGIDADTSARLVAHREFQAEERLLAGDDWDDQDMMLATQTGNRLSPGNFDQTLERLVKKAGVPRLTSHGLRHTAATHMVRQATDLGELRAVADILGHSPEMLMTTYAHALPDSLRAVSDRVGERVSGWDT